MSEIKVNKISPASGTETTLGDSSDDFLLPSGAEIIAQSGSTITVASGATIANAGTATGFGGGGKVLQMQSSLTSVAEATTGIIPSDNTKPQSGEGVNVTSLAITPQSATSSLHIMMQMAVGRSGGAVVPYALFVDSDVDALAVGGVTPGTTQATIATGLSHIIIASASTSARTYKLRAGADAATGTAYINRTSGSATEYNGLIKSGLIITEIEAL